MAVPAAFGHNTNHTQLLHPSPLNTNHHHHHHHHQGISAAPLIMGNNSSTVTAHPTNGTLAPSHAWFVPGYVASIGNNGSSKAPAGGRDASKMRPQQGGGGNGTGFYIEEESVGEGYSYSDFQTVILSCLATLAPLVILVLGLIAVRMTYKFFRERNYYKSDSCGDARTNSSENMAKPLHSHLLHCDKKCSESHLDIEGDDFCNESSSNTSQMVKGNNHSSTNGSIITMTLKNNHLIVETEERNDIEEDSKETTMKYSPNARDGIFVVEVQQGVRRSPPVASVGVCTATTVTMATTTGDDNLSEQKQKQQALIHQPPDRFSEDSTDTTTQSYTDAQSSTSQQNHPPTKSPSLLTTVSYAGLATSNQSLSTDVHYSYGNQEEYNNGRYGYPQHCCGGGGCEDDGGVRGDLSDEGEMNYDDGDVEEEEECGGKKKFHKQRTDSTASTISYKPKIMSAIYKNRASLDLLTDIDHSKLLQSNNITKPERGEGDLDDTIQMEQNLLGNSTIAVVEMEVPQMI